MSQPTTLPVAPDSVKLLESSAALRAISDAMRHALLRALLDGRPQSVNELAARFNRPPFRQVGSTEVGSTGQALWFWARRIQVSVDAS